MSGAQYLYRRDSGTYYIRLCVPARLKVAVGKGEIHRTTGCRDYRLAKIVAAELAAHWHRAIQALERMDISKIKAGSIKLLGDGYIPLIDAAEASGTTPSSLAQRLSIRQAHFFVEANDWLGRAVEDIHESLEHIQDELGQVEVVIDANKMGGPAAQRRFSGLLRIRFPEEMIPMVRTNQPAGLCQFLLRPSPDRGFICDLPGQPVDSQMLQIRRIDVEAMRLDLAAQLTPDMLATAHPTLPQPDTTTTLPTSSTGMTFSAFRDEYLKRNAGFWKADQVRRRQDQFEAFLEPVPTCAARSRRRLSKLPHWPHAVPRQQPSQEQPRASENGRLAFFIVLSQFVHLLALRYSTLLHSDAAVMKEVRSESGLACLSVALFLVR